MQTLRTYFVFVFLIASLPFAVAGGIKTPPNQSLIKFTENKNQWDTKVLYRAQLDGGALFLEKNCFTYNFYDKEALRANHLHKKANSHNSDIRFHAFRMSFLNAQQGVQASAQKPTSDYTNYFLGSDKSKWAGNVKNYTEVNYKELYSGIDLQILGLDNSMKYNFIVAPLGNPNDIQLNYEGLDNLTLEKGALRLSTSINEMIEQKPFAYQWIGSQKVEVPCEFILENNTVSFNFPRGYNKAFELVIDPILVFACSSGSIADNFGMTATYDQQGDLYSGGTVFGVGYPVTVGVYDPTWNGAAAYLGGRTDVVITKYDSSGTFLQYSTYIGGFTGSEIVTSLVVDGQENLLLYGATGSTDFPTTAGAYDQTFNGGTYMSFVANGTKFSGGTDIYVAKFNPTGTTLMASTYIGGNKNDGVNNNNDTVFISAWGVYEYPLDSLQYNYGDQYRGEINVDPFGNAYISSSSRSSDFPTVNGFDNTLGGQQDAVVFKLNPDFTSLLWSTYLGGTDNDAGYAIVLDDSLNVFVSGGTRSNNFPTTPGVVKPTYCGGKADGYITKIKNDGSAILLSTYWGTAAYDQTYFVQLDKNDNVYVVGQTAGTMPVIGAVYNNPNSGQFITKMNDSLNTIVFSTVFGNGNGQPNISPSAFLVDYCENIYVSGWGGNIITGVSTTTMPLTADAIQPTTDGFNFYLFVLSTNATSLLYATYFGGALSQEHVDGGTSRFDKKGIVYQSVCAGCGGHDDFPVTPGSWPNTGANVNHNTQNNNCNNGVFKFDFQVALADANFTVDYIDGCAPLTVQFENQSTAGGAYLWDFGGGDTTSSVLNPVRTFPTPGTYLVQLLVNNPASCNVWDTAYQYVTVHPSITADFDFTTVPCTNQFSFYDSSATAPVAWAWSFDDGGTSTLQNPSHTYGSTGTYNVQLISTTAFGCKDTTVVTLSNTTPATNIGPGDTICVNAPGVQLNAFGGFAYSWAPAATLSSSTISNPVAQPTTTTTYTASISTLNALGDTCIQTQTVTVFVIDPSVYPLSISANHDTISAGETSIIHVITDTTLAVNFHPGGTADSTGYYFTVSPTETTTYTASILDSTGCPRTVNITIYVLSMSCRSEDVFVPNTFTPNGDGQNDVLFVRSNVMEELYFAVYNRWGQMVFETTDMTEGWDGIYNGMKADPAVFAWYLRVKCHNGDEIRKKGNTTLIR